MKHQRVVSDVQATMILATTLLLLVQWQRVSSINAMWCLHLSICSREHVSYGAREVPMLMGAQTNTIC